MPSATVPHPLDEKARTILFDTYWKGGWIAAPQTDPADLAYAQAQGMMFAPVTRSHDECLSQRLECRDHLPARTAGRAFVASLACAGVLHAADLDRPRGARATGATPAPGAAKTATAPRRRPPGSAPGSPDRCVDAARLPRRGGPTG
ncbi:hypothetical protein [Bordetella genomosp. 1]|uniref:Uncharacterized protein n=1 Tax=Bordetella genomosp. 1 TaxID=1395607 RepID=A0ABX4ETP4_9BORD|nr:hypothetical protein [Bordetella genomosp. 1]OZI57149.1 hypothetical protein CAL27_23165 [Bordetella genomosp. 1]